MNYRPSKAFLICLTPLLATGATGAWAWNRATQMPVEMRQHTSFFKALRQEDYLWDVVPPLSPSQRAKIAPLVKAAAEKEERDFPSLKLSERPVPDDQNGFLEIYKLSGAPMFTGHFVGPEFEQLLGGTTPWDPVLAKRLLAENAAVVSRIEAMAALETRSSSHMPKEYCGFFGARAAKYAVEILLLKARLAAEAKDEAEALRLTKAAVNFIEHLSGIEAPNLLVETVAILIDLEIHHEVFSHLLPPLGQEADLVQWKSILARSCYSSADFSNILRAEWHSSGRLMFLPLVLNDEAFDHPPDPDALVHVLASRYNDLVTTAAGTDLDQLNPRIKALGESFTAPPALSKKSQKILEVMFIGVRAWSRGYVRTAVMQKQYQAAFDVLIEEKQGGRVGTGPVPGATVDILSGQPFSFDARKRELSAPAATEKEAEVKPLALPW